MREELYLDFLKDMFECPANFDLITDYDDEEMERVQIFCNDCDIYCNDCWKLAVKHYALNRKPQITE